MEGEVEMRDVGDHEDRVVEWEDGLPNADDLTPLSQLLITPELASAFSIRPEPCRTIADVNRAAQSTISSLRKQNKAYAALSSFGDEASGSRDSVVEVDSDRVEAENENDNSEKRKSLYSDPEEEEEEEEAVAPASKRARLVWTPQLHKRFVEVVGHLGIKDAVPKTIMHLMNVEGLTRENVASHLQKYRLYIKRMHGLSNRAPPPSPSDHLFASTPVPPTLNDAQYRAPQLQPIPMPYAHHPLIPLPLPPTAAYHGFHPHQYNMYMEQQRDWSGNRFGSIVSHHHISPNNK